MCSFNSPPPLLHAFLLRRLRHHVLHLQLHHQDQYSVPNVNWHFSELVLFFTFEPFQRPKFFAKIMLQTLISVRKMAVLYLGHCKKTRLYVLLLQVAKGGCFSRRRWWWCWRETTLLPPSAPPWPCCTHCVSCVLFLVVLGWSRSRFYQAWHVLRQPHINTVHLDSRPHSVTV